MEQPDYIEVSKREKVVSVSGAERPEFSGWGWTVLTPLAAKAG